MLSVLPTLALLTSYAAGSSIPPRTIAKRGLSDIVWQGGLANGTNGDRSAWDSRSPAQNGGAWDAKKPDLALDAPGQKVGYRLKADHANEAVLVLNNNTLMDAAYTGPADSTPTLQNFATIGDVAFTNSASDATSGDIWTNAAGFQPLDWVVSFDLTNGCSDTKTFNITTVDAKGAVNTTSAVNWISGVYVSRGAANVLPVNLTITWAEDPAASIAVTYYDSQALTYKLGTGPTQPSIVPPSIYSDIFWCDID
ncbi:hypothetical protein FIBSPDRAFT_1042644 [Athelia psychrophila]|uniref:Glycoside hydrolase family 16 protein n=1 Tax=Athelia psychrophila TaxID=1759441 RepID=A0A166MA94_9AGAM|nr:hypothetical protein FIBSPDRAFT_1042644 [Fibularhizoctonia sp. CBS 109695]